MELIDKAAVVAEIERKIKSINSCPFRTAELGSEKLDEGRLNAYNEIISYLDTLKVKEVDLEKELESWRHNHFHGRRNKEANGEYLERTSQLNLAKYFFELGIKAQKGE